MIKRLGLAIGRFVALILTALFGRIHWQAPAWITRGVGRALIVSGATINSKRRQNPRAFWSTLTTILILAAGGAGAWRWYELQPKPERYTISGANPVATALIDDAKIDPLHLKFSGSAAKLEDVGKKITSGIQMEPALKGDWKWESDQELSFTPTQDWAVGEKYAVTLAKSLFPKHVLLDSYSFEFNSAPFAIQLEAKEFFTDLKDPKIKKVTATFKASHPIDGESFKEHLVLRKKTKKSGKLELSSEKVPFTVSFDKFMGTAYIQTENLPIPKDDQSLVIELEKGVKSSRGGEGFGSALFDEVSVPSMYTYFKIGGVDASYVRNETFEPEAVMVVNATAGTMQDLLQKRMTVQLLPKDRPAAAGREVQKDYSWSSIDELGGDVMRLAKPVKLSPIPTDKEWANLLSFKHDVKPGRYLFVKIDKGLKAYGDYELAKPFEAIVKVPDLPKELVIMHEGSLLSLTGERKISLLARGLSAARLEIGRIKPSDISHLITQTYGKFQDPKFSGYNFNQDNLIERFTEYRTFSPDDDAKAQYTSLDLSSYTSKDGVRRGLFFLKAEGWDEKAKVATFPHDERLILVTDMGLMVKHIVGGGQDVFVMSISTGKPVAGAKIDILGKNGLSVVSEMTDAEGHATFPKLYDFTREKQPTLYLATKGDDLAFLPIDRGDRFLSLSHFDTGGEYSNSNEGQLSAYLFSDRGIYRPGDEMNFGMIVRAASWSKDLHGLPLEAVLTDSRGLVVLKKKIEVGQEAFEELRYATRDNSPTGDYQLSIYVIRPENSGRDFLGSTTVRVEEFLPDRMRITAAFSKARTEGWVSPADLKALVSLQNLFGTPAASRRASGAITLTPWAPAFPAYKDYFFFDPAKAKNSFSETLNDQTTDDKGEATFDLDLKRFTDATYRLVFRSEGFEAEGGRAVIAQTSIMVSPNAYLIGYKPDGSFSFVQKNAARSVNLIAVGPELQRKAVGGLKAHLVELRYTSVLTKQGNGVYKYESVRKEITVNNKPLQIPASGLDYKLPTEQSGTFALIIRDAQDLELSRVEYTVVGASNLAGNLEKNAELHVSLDKEDYAPGDTIKIDVKAPYTGAGLITIERDKVHAFKWFTANTTSSVQSIKVPEGLEGNGYINISFVRDVGSKEIFMSPLSYGVIPFSVSREKRINKITLSAPELVKPGDSLKITYQTPKPSKIVVYAVDEGILQVARYKLPDPLGFFFKKKALEVRTSQILDLILPEYSIVKALASPGGDADGMMGANLNPFKRKRQKPVVFWSGMVDAGPEPRDVTYLVPDYFNGSLKIMAVAVSAESIGVTKKDATVRGPFVINPNAPTFIAPGDEAVVSVAVANNVEGSGDKSTIKLELKTSEHLEIVGDSTQTQEVALGREETFIYKIRGKTALGSGNLAFTASSGAASSHFETELSVRPPVPRYTNVRTGTFKDGSETVGIERRMYPEYRKLEAAESILPLGLARGLITYLENYPYLCTEQLVSAMMPKVLLSHRPEFNFDRKDVDTQLADIISALRSRQNEAGGFGMWVANASVSDQVSAYVTHFLLEAQDRGMPVPADMVDRALNYLADTLTRPAPDLATARTQAYSIYLMTRHGRVTTNQLDALLSQLREREAKTWEQDLTGAYIASTFKLLKQDTEADKLIGSAKFGLKTSKDPSSFFVPLSGDSQLLYLSAKHFPDRIKSVQGEAINQLVDSMAHGQYNTIAAAYTIMALDAYADASDPATSRSLSVMEIFADHNKKPLALSPGVFGRADFSEAATALEFSAAGEGPAFYQVTESGFDKALPKEALKAKLEVVRDYRDEENNVVTTAKVGDKLTVHVKVRAIEAGSYQNIAVVDLLPAGFEIEMNRIAPTSVRQSLPQTTHEEESSTDDGEGGDEGEGAAPEKIRDTPSPSAPEGEAWISPIATADSTWRTDYVDAREDRIVIFGGISKEASEFIYKIRATNSGTFQIPPIYAESMYEPAVKALSLGGQMKVEDR